MSTTRTYDERGELIEIVHHGASESMLIGGSRYDSLVSEQRSSQALHQLPTPMPKPPVRPVTMTDVECYRNFFLVKFYDRVTKQFTSYRQTRAIMLDRAAVAHKMRTCTLVTFNGRKYDAPMIACALAGFTCDQLKKVSDAIIQRNMQPWQVEQEFGVTIPQEWDHIDLFEVAPGIASLKIYGGRLHSKKMQDLPYDISAELTLVEMDNTDLYCGNDLLTTNDLYEALIDDIETRIELTTQYGVDMRSKSDAQIAEAAFKKLLAFKVYPPVIPPGTRFKYETPKFISFKTTVLQQALALIERVDFVIANNGSPAMPIELDGFTVTIGSSTYTLGIGGLHSTEQKTAHRADATYSLADVDVVSYYPKIISILKMFPHQIGEVFLKIYDGWIEVRIEYKDAGNKKKAATFKIKINGTYGKTGSPYSILYAPQLMIRTTITGQLSLLMLIERLHMVDGISVVSANTDGVVIKCRRDLHPVRDAIVKRWELDTGFTTEANEYLALFSRDINNYIAFKPAYTDKKGVHHPISTKTKGAFAIGKEDQLRKNPANFVCVDAVIAYILHGTPVETTIRQCSDIRKFVTVRAVKGGGAWIKDTLISTTIKARTADLERRMWVCNPTTKLWSDVFGSGSNLTLNEAYETARRNLERLYLGKAVRWYYGAGQSGHIAYALNGNLVARSEGAKPCMELPDVLPPDIDYGWYAEEATELLQDLGVV